MSATGRGVSDRFRQQLATTAFLLSGGNVEADER